MTPAIKEVLLAISGSLPASVVVKVTAVTALALFAVWLARGSRAAVRHALLAAAFGVMLLLPLASAIVPVHLEVPMVVENRTSASTPLLRGDGEVAPILITHDPDVRVLSAPYSRGISLSKLLLTGWIAGVAIFLLPLLIGLWQIRLFRRSGLPWPHGQSLAGEIARDAGIYRRVEVVLHEGVPGPMTCGILRPGIVLPQDAETWNEEDLSRAFVHELEHVRRGDWVSSCLARAVCAVYWFHPLVWIAWRRLALEAERSCDDAVLRRSDATAYAEQLVGLAKRLYAAQRSPVVAMANRADLTTRVRAMLDTRQQRGRAGPFSLGLATASAMRAGRFDVVPGFGCRTAGCSRAYDAASVRCSARRTRSTTRRRSSADSTAAGTSGGSEAGIRSRLGQTRRDSDRRTAESPCSPPPVASAPRTRTASPTAEHGSRP